MSETVATVYPPDALPRRSDLDVIGPDLAPTLDAQFRERVRRSPNKVAYTEYDPKAELWRDYTWAETAAEVVRWQAALRAEGLDIGDRVALRVRNCRHWVIFDQAALGLGLVVVPLYTADRPDNVNYVLDHADARLLLVEDGGMWQELDEAGGETRQLERVISLAAVDAPTELVIGAQSWLEHSSADGAKLAEGNTEPEQLASIVYTSGTTGRPKGVMLSHRNMVANAYSGLRSVPLTPNEVLLSFLPLSHTLERTVGYYVPLMAGCQVAYTRSISQLAEDMMMIRPTGIITVPRIFERIYGQLKAQLQDAPSYKRWLFEQTVAIGWARFEHSQGRGPWRIGFLLWPLLDNLVASKVRDRLGGRLDIAVVGGAACPPAVSRVFVAFGINVLQGYGLTESSPSISINTRERNIPTSIGMPLHDVEVRIGDNDELLARGPNVMMGYWKNKEATRAALDDDGWLHTGDQAKIDNGYITITGRIKDILVLANGEKVPPADMESAIAENPLFDQSLIIGEGKPYLSALVVLNEALWAEVAAQLGVSATDETVLTDQRVEQALLERITAQVREFPGYARVRRVTATLRPWTVEEGLATPTMKLKRAKILERYQAEIAGMYEGHDLFRARAADGGH